MLGTDAKVFVELRNVIGEHFVEKMKTLNIMDLLEEQLSQPSDERRFAESRVDRALAACRPLWQAEVGVMSHYFSDMIIVGTPDSYLCAEICVADACDGAIRTRQQR